VDYRSFITTKAEPKLCPKCGALILEGHTDGLPYRVELDPINWAGEIAAVVDGQATYQYQVGRLIPRDARSMAAASADDTAVLVWHRCRRVVPAAHRSARRSDPLSAAILEAKLKYGATDCEPPF
jgi:hypothetical protein